LKDSKKTQIFGNKKNKPKKLKEYITTTRELKKKFIILTSKENKLVFKKSEICLKTKGMKKNNEEINVREIKTFKSSKGCV